MLEYIIKRIGLALLTLLVIVAVSYFLLRMAPGDPTRSTNLLGGDQNAGKVSSDKNELAENTAMREKLHLDKPAYIGFFYWLKGVVLHGDFGSSATVDPGRPVLQMIGERLPVTLSINIWAVLITYLLAIPLGIFSALNPGGKFDRGVTIVLFLMYSLPVIWVGLVLQATLCSGGKFPVFPLKGLEIGDTSMMTTWQIMGSQFMHYFLPVLCLAYGGFAGLSRYARTGMIEVIRQDYIRTAKAKGVSEFYVIFKHALRNSLITLITLFAGLLPGLVAGSIIIEHVFSIAGMGSLSLLALTSRDYPLQMALFGIAGTLTLSGILLSDVLYVMVDPRISFSGKKL